MLKKRSKRKDVLIGREHREDGGFSAITPSALVIMSQIPQNVSQPGGFYPASSGASYGYAGHPGYAFRPNTAFYAHQCSHHLPVGYRVVSPQGVPMPANAGADMSAPTPPANGIGGWFNFSNSDYLKGFVLGAGVALLVANPSVQRAVVTGAIKLWGMFQGGVEEVKEQIRDIQAEMSQKES